jgi:hypothetical protein
LVAVSVAHKRERLILVLVCQSAPGAGGETAQKSKLFERSEFLRFLQFGRRGAVGGFKLRLMKETLLCAT